MKPTIATLILLCAVAWGQETVTIDVGSGSGRIDLPELQPQDGDTLVMTVNRADFPVYEFKGCPVCGDTAYTDMKVVASVVKVPATRYDTAADGLWYDIIYYHNMELIVETITLRVCNTCGVIRRKK